MGDTDRLENPGQTIFGPIVEPAPESFGSVSV
jgi:hypothetical protein